MKIFTSLFFALFFALGCAALPALAHEGKHDASSAQTHRHQTGWVKGEVIKIDKPRKHIVLKHEEIVSIGMDAMTMPFKVKNAALLDRVKVGDKVRFDLDATPDELTVVKLEVLK